MCVHAPAGGVVTPPPKYCNEEKTKQLLKRPPIRCIIAAFFRLVGDILEPITPQSRQPSLPDRNNAQSNMDAMLACFRAGQSWQDAMDQSEVDR